MKKNVISMMLIVLLMTISFFSCKDEKGMKKEQKDGFTHIYNPSTPLKGKVKLELEKIFEIDSSTLKKVTPVFFKQSARSLAQGRTYLSDNLDFKIYIFDETGKLLKHFLQRGEGPGEFNNAFEYSIHPLGNDVWIPGLMKIARFNPDGEFIEEFKFSKAYRNMEILDENRFIGNYYKLTTGQQGNANNLRKDVCVLMDKGEGILKELAEEDGTGGTFVNTRLPNGNNFNVDFALDIISPLLLHSISTDRQKVYIGRTDEYIVKVKNLNGETQLVIHRNYENILLSAQDRKEIIDDVFFRQPPEIKKAIQDNLPAKFNAILKLVSLPGDHLAVYRLTGIRSFKIDIFDKEGRYIYELELPQDMERRILIAKDVISDICLIDDRDVYRAYRIKNLPEIFKK
ncbi:MAG: 6-bladed beta-propeller [Acidobacteria bacterium]|nr:6-bladed beta-propeller [Acidobacteriota bacterium]